MMSRANTFFEKVAERLMDAISSERCPECGGKVKHEYFHPPVFVLDGTTGLRKRCAKCGHTEVVWCRGGI